MDKADFDYLSLSCQSKTANSEIDCLDNVLRACLGPTSGSPQKTVSSFKTCALVCRQFNTPFYSHYNHYKEKHLR